jgi:hypothetical protein
MTTEKIRVSASSVSEERGRDQADSQKLASAARRRPETGEDAGLNRRIGSHSTGSLLRLALPSGFTFGFTVYPYSRAAARVP